MFLQLIQNPSHFRFNLVMILALAFVCGMRPLCIAEEVTDFASDDLPTYTSPYRLNHRLLLGASIDALIESDDERAQFFDGYSVGVSAEFFLLPFFSTGLRYDRFYFTKTSNSNSSLSIHSFVLMQRIVPAASAVLSPYIAVGFGLSRGNRANAETVQAGVGFQFRPDAGTWARIEATTVAIGFMPRASHISIDGISNNIFASSWGVRFEFGLVY